MIDHRHICNVIYNARAGTEKHPTTPTSNQILRLATKNDFSSCPGAFSIVQCNSFAPNQTLKPSQSAAPATNSVPRELHEIVHLPRKVAVEPHQIVHLPREVTLELHQIVHLPRKVTLELHEIVHLPRKVTLQLHQIMHLPRHLTLLNLTLLLHPILTIT